MLKNYFNQRGQATIEFILSFSFMLFFTLFFVTIGVNLAIGYVVHYAVYKSSRHYLTYDDGSDSNNVLRVAETNASSVFQVFQRDLNLKGEFKIHSPDSMEGSIYEYVGAKFLFSPKIKAMGPFALSEDYSLLSESFLGKEPTRADCKCQTQRAIDYEYACESDIDPSIEITVYDNGC
jgi:hypothetical protein